MHAPTPHPHPHPCAHFGTHAKSAGRSWGVRTAGRSGAVWWVSLHKPRLFACLFEARVQFDQPRDHLGLNCIGLRAHDPLLSTTACVHASMRVSAVCARALVCAGCMCVCGRAPVSAYVHVHVCACVLVLFVHKRRTFPCVHSDTTRLPCTPPAFTCHCRTSESAVTKNTSSLRLCSRRERAHHARLCMLYVTTLHARTCTARRGMEGKGVGEGKRKGTEIGHVG